MTAPLKTIIIDDEELARKRLKRLLKPYAATIEIIAEAVNGADGLEKVETLSPDLIFLDIEMPVYNGFEMLSRLTRHPRVVFTTAYDQYAIKAFEEDSVDYLLKPVEAERLEKTINRLAKSNLPVQDSLPLEALLKHLKPRKELKTLTVKLGDRILLVKLEDIAYIQAEEKYVFLFCTDGTKHLTEFTLASLEEKLPENFVRIHRSIMINSSLIKEIRKGFGNLVFVLSDKESSRLASSRRLTDDLKEHFGI